MDAFADRELSEVFPSLHCVYVRRSDHLRQAISYARAIQTGQWASDHDIRNSELRFDRAEISALMARIEREEQLWERYFADRSIAPLRTVYEDFRHAPGDTVRAILTFLGVSTPPGLEIPPATLGVQADQLTELWAARFRGDLTIALIPFPKGEHPARIRIVDDIEPRLLRSSANPSYCFSHHAASGPEREVIRLG